ncbi:MAG: hypothetical protein FJ395_16980 [Verrucomicrobia bacterium]|nr:hypothetical protein [Verrucomicrobiota bacterium]
MTIASRIYSLAVLLLLAGCASPPPPTTTETSPAPAPQASATEVRAVWVSDTTRLNWDTATAALQRAGFNTMYVNIASGGAAFYPRSAVLPSVVSKDELERGIQLAHQRGIAVHAKFIAAFMFKVPPSFQQQLTAANCVSRGPDGRPVLQNGQTWLCPSQKINRGLITGAIRETLARYPVDGVQLDYIRFCEQPSCFCLHCRRQFEQAVSAQLKRWPADVMSGAFTSRFIEWKQQVINDWMRECHDEVRKARPGLPISAAVFGEIARAREEKAQDWKLWLDRGWLDYVCTMTYTAPLADFETRVRGQRETVPGQQLVVGIGSWKLRELADITAQVEIVRRHGAAGFAMFSYDDFAGRNVLPSVR